MIIWLNQPKPSFAQQLLAKIKNGGVMHQLGLAVAASTFMKDAIREAAIAQERQILEQLMQGQAPTVFVSYDELDSRVTSDMMDAMRYAMPVYSPQNAIRIAGV